MGRRISTLAAIVIGVLFAGLSGCGYNDLQGLDEDTKAAWSEVVAISLGLARGFASVITTQVHSRSGSYPYTRPIYVDIVSMGALFAFAVAWVGVVIWASRDAAQWEETDAPHPSRYRI